MKTRIFLVAVFLLLLGAGLGWWWSAPKTGSEAPRTTERTEATKPADPVRSGTATRQSLVVENRINNPQAVSKESALVEPALALTKVELLEQTRAHFNGLAGGDAKTALAAAREIKDEGEREVALTTLITRWRNGELNPPRKRATAIATLGLEAGLGMELAQDPALAVLWANELTEGKNRMALLQGVASEQLNVNPAAAFALADQFSGNERRQFLDTLLQTWAGKDTDAALGWAEQLSDPTEHDAAIQAIRQVAPVGIGTQVAMRDGYAVVGGLLPGTPAELSGQIHAGDRIVGIAQGDSRFVDAAGLSLPDVVQMIRGAPGTMVQLQLVAADAAPNTSPRTVSLVRDQIRHKQ